MKAKKIDGRLYLEIPEKLAQEFGEDPDVEVYRMGDGIFLVANLARIKMMIEKNLGINMEKVVQDGKIQAEETSKKEAEAEKKEIKELLDEEELKIIEKLEAIKFAHRVKESVEKIFNEKEREILKNLLNKKAVTIYKGKTQSIYNITDEAYSIFVQSRRNARAMAAQTTKPQTSTSANARAQPPVPEIKPAAEMAGTGASFQLNFATSESASPRSLLRNESLQANIPKEQASHGEVKFQQIEKDRLALLWKQGYAIFPTENEARSASEKLEQEIKRKEVLGIRGFDRNYYVATRAFYESNSPKVRAAIMKQEKSSEEVAQEIKMDEEAVKVVLRLLGEEGEVIEKRKGRYISI